MMKCKVCGFEIPKDELVARFNAGMGKCPECNKTGQNIKTTASGVTYIADGDFEEVKEMNLFQLGSFVLHSGKRSHYKIECDALTDKDLETLAFMLNEKLPVTFCKVEGVPRGGLRFAKAMEIYQEKNSPLLLIVDDVFTTGRSIQEHAKGASGYYAGVIFARNPCPGWVIPVWQL